MQKSRTNVDKVNSGSLVNRISKRLIIVTALILAIGLGLTQTASANPAYHGDSISQGVDFEGDAFLFGNDVVLDGTVRGDVLALGSNVTINGTVEGSLVAAGENVTVNGEIEGSVYSAAVTFQLGESAVIGRSLYFVGARLATNQGSEIGRDLYAASLGAELSGDVERDVKAVIGIIEIVSRILNRIEGAPGDLLPIRAPGVESSPVIAMRSDILSQDKSESFISKTNQLSKRTDIKNEASPKLYQVEEDAVDQAAVTRDMILNPIRQLISFLIIGGLVIWIKPKLFRQWTEHLRTRPAASAGYGFVVFVMGFVGTFILALIILGIGVVLTMATLNALAIVVWGLGFSGLSFGFWSFLLFALFISKIIVSYVAGWLLLNRFFPRGLNRSAWPLLLGLIIYVILRAVPCLGLIIGLVVTFFGLGAVWLAYSERNSAISHEELVFEEE
jgi:cytoskeletal protein CcmA (bactofilin family)